MTTATTLCPAATGDPTEEITCASSGAEHRCKCERTQHWIHECACGVRWYSATTLNGKRLVDADESEAAIA